ncbi:hypothetical protein ACRALDRAFT_1059755 [Sodiomyces alcalophilus JCM 7366]|uniref:uncharacterized protein n=1 Tax=Sodiomyces alcalophilus JCM 7366 TaxID=591952 RepID=UPI0039B669C3
MVERSVGDDRDQGVPEGFDAENRRPEEQGYYNGSDSDEHSGFKKPVLPTLPRMEGLGCVGIVIQFLVQFRVGSLGIHFGVLHDGQSSPASMVGRLSRWMAAVRCRW